MTQQEIAKLQDQIARECVGILSMTGMADSAEQSENALRLIGKAWGCAPETTQQNLDLIQREKDVIRLWETQDEVTHALTEEEMLHAATGAEIVEMLWGCFETAVRLSDAKERTAMLEMARYLETCFNLEDQVTRHTNDFIEQETRAASGKTSVPQISVATGAWLDQGMKEENDERNYQ